MQSGNETAKTLPIKAGINYFALTQRAVTNNNNDSTTHGDDERE